MPLNLKVLVVEDSVEDCLLLVQHLEDAGMVVEHQRVESAASLVGALEARAWDLVISDYSLPGFSGTSALALVRARTRELPFIFVSGVIGEDLAVAAMVAGANDYVMKHNLMRLVPAIERELREAEAHRNQHRLEEALERSEERFSRIFQASPVAIALLSARLDRIIDANPACARVAKTSVECLREPDAFAGLLSPLDLARIRDLLVREGGARNIELELRDATGECSFVLVTFERLELDSDHCVLMLMQVPGAVSRARSHAA